MKIIKILLLILILFLGSGCIILPLPSEDTFSMRAYEEKLKKLTVGSTTKDEVISILGEPDVKRKRFILYKARVKSGTQRIFMGYFIPIGGTCCAGGKVSRTAGKWMDVSFEFDEHGILTEYRLIKPVPLPEHEKPKCISNCYSEQSICKGNSPYDPGYKCAKKVKRCLNTCY